ncbi:hypothetical protein SAZ_12525 [Streptomyces noursei ZPM]|nr:hypothetical protein SAZ_12525 [Streptomyces noursei ZPM]
MPASARIARARAAIAASGSGRPAYEATRCRVAVYSSGCRTAKTMSSSSVLSAWTPRRSASGISTSRVTPAIRACFSGRITPRVRMLCSRSASLMDITRTSLPVATSILRKVSGSAAAP